MSRSVLLIDDEAGYRQSLVQRLTPEGYHFFEADSPLAGIRFLDANPQVCVVLLDLSLGEQSGTVVLDHLRERSADYRVIVLTAHDELLAAERAGEYDVFTYLPKARRSSFQALRFSLDQAFKDLERAALARKIELIQEVQRRINANRNATETLDLICDAAREVVGAYTCHIRVYDFASGDFYLSGFAPVGSLREAFSQWRAKGQLFSGKVVVTGRPEWADNLQQDEHFLAIRRQKLVGRSISSDEAQYWETVSSSYIVPISTGFFGSAVDAVLNVSSQLIAYFDLEKRALVDEFVDLASLAITKDWLLRRRAELHDDYSRISSMLGDMRDRLSGHDVLRGLCRTVTEKLSELVNAEVVSIFLYNERTRRIENVGEYRGVRYVEAPEEDYEVGQSFVGRVFETGQTLLLQTTPDGVKPHDDRRFDHRHTEHYSNIIPSGTLEHFLAVPIRAGGRTLGVLQAMNKKSSYYDEVIDNGQGSQPSQPLTRSCLLERGFSTDVRSVVEITASHLAIAIQNARLLNESGRQVLQLRTLGEVGRIISSELDSQTVLEQTIQAMAMVMQAEICMLFLRDDGEERIILRQCYGIPKAEIAGASYRIGEGVTGMVAATGKAKLVERPGASEGRYDGQIRRYLTERDGRLREIESVMVVPIMVKSTPVGVMKVINKVGDDPHYRPSDLRLFRMFGQYVGMAIENAQIYELTNQRLAIAERNAALALLVKAVAHQITNTSGVIPPNVTAIKEALGEVDERISRMLALIDRAAKRAIAFANELEQFWVGRTDRRRAMNIGEIVRGVIDELQFELPKYRNAKTIRMETDLASSLVCEVYEESFAEIVKNILLNAVQALENTEGGVIRVATYSSAGEAAQSAVLQFEDNGPGISPKHLPRLFDPDFSTKQRGYGLGLWLVRTKVEELGGKIEVKSEPGNGARFTITIPLAANAARHADEQTAAGIDR